MKRCWERCQTRNWAARLKAQRHGRPGSEDPCWADRGPIGSIGPGPREEEALLGTAPDPEIGKRINRQAATVGARRHKLGIAAAPYQPRNGWTREEDAVLGTAKDAEVARRLGRPIGGVRGRRKALGLKSPAFKSTCRRWTADEDALLGKMRDEEVAARTGPSVDRCVAETALAEDSARRAPKADCGPRRKTSSSEPHPMKRSLLC
jgi:hypothetical protein